MVDMENLKTVSSILEDRSGIDIREALVHNWKYLNNYESFIYNDEVEYLLEKYGLEEEPPF